MFLRIATQLARHQPTACPVPASLIGVTRVRTCVRRYYVKTEILNVRIDPDLYAALKEQQTRTGCAISEYIRRALRLSLFADEPKIEKRQQP